MVDDDDADALPYGWRSMEMEMHGEERMMMWVIDHTYS